jgi:hypothetical protein
MVSNKFTFALTLLVLLLATPAISAAETCGLGIDRAELKRTDCFNKLGPVATRQFNGLTSYRGPANGPKIYRTHECRLLELADDGSQLWECPRALSLDQFTQDKHPDSKDVLAISAKTLSQDGARTFCSDRELTILDQYAAEGWDMRYFGFAFSLRELVWLDVEGQVYRPLGSDKPGALPKYGDVGASDAPVALAICFANYGEYFSVK